MADIEENPFVTGHTEEGAADPVPSTSSISEEQQRSGVEEAKGDVTGLVPLCVRHVDGPQINSAVFGYDIAQMQKRPWNDPAANVKDYFNYGFNETSWRVYCAMQAEGEASLLRRANDFLAQLNGSAMKGSSVEEAVGGGDGNSYYMPSQSSSHAYYGPPRDNFLKTKLCQRFAEGRCVKGDHCSYAHGHGELRATSQHHQHHQHQHQHQHHQHQHHQHQHHQHQHQQPQQEQHHQLPSYILPPFSVDQGMMLQMGVPSTGVLDPNVAGGYRMMPKRQRSPDGTEGQTYDASY